MLWIIRSTPKIIIENNKIIHINIWNLKTWKLKLEGTPWNKPQTSKSWNHAHIELGSKK
jgi:hypothetical protein